MFDWAEFVDVADSLMSPGAEARWRSAMGRAYYGVFGVLCAKVGRMGEVENVHAKVIGDLKSSPDPDHQTLGALLEAARKDRTSADYRPMDGIDELRAKGSIRRARTILEIARTVRRWPGP